jgi:hypothetical protein
MHDASKYCSHFTSYEGIIVVIDNTMAMKIPMPPKNETGQECDFFEDGKSKIFLV